MRKRYFVSALLESKHPELFRKIISTLQKTGKEVSVIESTRDIWCRDYMPVNDVNGKLVSFQYNPLYLQHDSQKKLRSDPQVVCSENEIYAIKCSLILDGGSVLWLGRTVLISDRVLLDNPWYLPADIEIQLYQTLKPEHLMFIPELPGDPTGHLDGIFLPIDEDTLLLSDYRKLSDCREWDLTVRAILKKNRIVSVNLPYLPPPKLSSLWDARGVYVNALDAENLLLVPSYSIKGEEKVFKQLADCFPKREIHPIPCSTLARKGGAVHCVTWESHLRTTLTF